MPTNKRSRRDNATFDVTTDHRGRPIIPGERRSTRVTSGAKTKESSVSPSFRDDDSVSNASHDLRPSGSVHDPDRTMVHGNGNGDAPKKAGKVRGMKGYAWVEEWVPTPQPKGASGVQVPQAEDIVGEGEVHGKDVHRSNGSDSGRHGAESEEMGRGGSREAATSSPMSTE